MKTCRWRGCRQDPHAHAYCFQHRLQNSARALRSYYARKAKAEADRIRRCGVPYAPREID